MVDYSDPSWVDRVKELTNGRGADVIYDPVGGDIFAIPAEGGPARDLTPNIQASPSWIDWLPNGRLHVIADAGHWPQWEKRDEFLRVHRDFLLGG